MKAKEPEQITCFDLAMNTTKKSQRMAVLSKFLRTTRRSRQRTILTVLMCAWIQECK